MVNNKVEVTLSHKDYIFLDKSLKDLRDTALNGAVHYANKRLYDDDFVCSHFWESFHKFEEVQRLIAELGLDDQLSYEDNQSLIVCRDCLNKMISASENKEVQ